MTHDGSAKPALFPLIADTISDLSDLVRKEARLAVAELEIKASATLRGAIGLVVAGLLGFVGLLVLSAGLVLAVALSGLALVWCCFIVAAFYFILGGAIALAARGGIGLSPSRTIAQLRKDAAMAKEQTR